LVSNTRPLFKRYPALQDKLPHTALGLFPTPVKPLGELAKELGIEQLWVKCDDISAEAYGGNKIRKLEFLLADALSRGCSTVLTFGGTGSNHALATSIYCRQLGLNCVVVLTPEPTTDAVRRTLRYHLRLGTRIEVATHYPDVRTTADRIIAEIGPDQVYEVPFGGSSWVGATGFVNAAFELQDQIVAGQLPPPDVVYMGCGTAGSTAGLALGFALGRAKGDSMPRIEAVQVTPDSVKPAELCRELFIRTAAKLQEHGATVDAGRLEMAAVNVRHDQLGEGYAIPTAAAREAAEMMSRREHIPTSLTYTAKTLAALIADARSGSLDDKRVLFWNTYNSRAYPRLANDDSWKKLPPQLHTVFGQ
jgi:D-cysteine desulfhydrase